MKKGQMVCLCLKNKGSAVRFCLWPQMALLKLKHLKKKYSLDIKKIAHVGAHRGQEVKEYKANFPEVEINLFEPQSNLFEHLLEEFKTDNKIFLCMEKCSVFLLVR